MAQTADFLRQRPSGNPRREPSGAGRIEMPPASPVRLDIAAILLEDGRVLLFDETNQVPAGIAVSMEVAERVTGFFSGGAR